MSVVVVIQSEEEAAGLARWGTRFAGALSADRITFFSVSGDRGSIETLVREVGAEFGGGISQQLLAVSGEDPEDEVLEHIRAEAPELVLVGKQQSDRVDAPAAKFARSLFERSPCQTLLLRLGGSEGATCARVLVPIGGGPHAREALRIAVRAVGEKGEVCAVRVQADAGQDAEIVGEHILSDLVRGAGLTGTEIARVCLQVSMNDNIAAGVRAVAEEQNFDLLLVGASNAARLRRILFGALPDRLLKAEGGMAVGVVRRARPVGHRIREQVERFLHLRVPQLDRETRIAVVEHLQLNSRWSFDFMTLIALSTLIAAFGLIQNSTPVVIGAMLVAPLMTPLLGSGLALVQGNLPLMRDCVRAIVYGFLGALLVGFFAGFVARGLGMLDGLTLELAARGNPSWLDIGVALASGVAASYCIARPGLSSALAGVAIAAALVPPIATVGISLALGEPLNALGAALLFATNVVMIVLGSGVNFFAAGIRPKPNARNSWARRTAFGLVVAAAALAIPLSSVILSKLAGADSPSGGAGFRDQVQQLLAADPAEPHLVRLTTAQSSNSESIRLIIDVSGDPGVERETLSSLVKLAGGRYGPDPVIVEIRGARPQD